MDKTGYAMGLALSAKVVVLRGRKQAFKTVDGSREQVSQVDCIGIGGKTIPPYIIFKGKQYTDRLQQMAEEAVPGCTIGMTENGQSSQEQGLSWLEHFK